MFYCFGFSEGFIFDNAIKSVVQGLKDEGMIA